LKSGKNIKLDVSLQTPIQCSKKNTLPLQQQTVYLNVNLNPKVKQTINNVQPNETARSPLSHDGVGNKQISVEHLDSSDSANLQNDGHESMLSTAQVQRFHSLYNSQLSVAQRNKLVRPIEHENNSKISNWTVVEIGVYTVLCVFGLALSFSQWDALCLRTNRRTPIIHLNSRRLRQLRTMEIKMVSAEMNNRV